MSCCTYFHILTQLLHSSLFQCQLIIVKLPLKGSYIFSAKILVKMTLLSYSIRQIAYNFTAKWCRLGVPLWGLPFQEKFYCISCNYSKWQRFIILNRYTEHVVKCLQTASTNVINVLWSLMEAGVEELKLLQTAILLITTNSVVQHDALAKVC